MWNKEEVHIIVQVNVPVLVGNRLGNDRQTKRASAAHVPSAIWSDHQKVLPTVFDGKRQGQLLVATRMAGQQMDRLLYVTDCESRLLILVDTSAEVSIIHVLPSNAERKN